MYFKLNQKTIFTLILFLWVNTFASSQSQSTYPTEINNKIKQVENNLVSWVKLDSTSNWNIYQRMKEMHVNGLSIAVINNYKIEWVKSYGWADTAQKRPVTDHTLFQSASIGKSIHGFAYMKLVKDKKVDLTKDINTYLRSWKFPYDKISKGKLITLGHLLSHTAELNVHGFDGYKWTESLPTLKQILNGEEPANNPAVRSEVEPGIKFEYSGGGYEISELLAEEVTNKSYKSLIETSIFKTLKMSNSTYILKPTANRAATAYRFDGKAIGCKYHLYPEKACGAGLWSTATDLAKFVIETQLSLEGKSSKIIDQERAKAMLTPYLPISNYGYGFFLEKRGKEEYFQHSGLNEGFSSQYYGSFKNGKGVVILTNSDNTDFLQEIVNSVATVYDWKDFYPSTTKKVVSLPKNILNKYVGKYRFQDEDTGPAISMENGNLYLLAPGSPTKWRMYFTSETEFFMLEAKWANQQFFMDANGKVAGHYILGSDSKQPVFKVE
ncbi:serine hydrolase [Adhaeribacter aquaticus]|uniref:serine hydrolase n=1 Tax=Adhaeribacter aquaticus TaxID=299567 RepID=UPI0004098D0E|nr:serine hydrolase [Adhaeribacter aquaticus]